MQSKCKSCYSIKLLFRGKLCIECYRDRERTRYFENMLKNEPWRFVECSGDNCYTIWRLQKKKIGEGGTSRTERYRRSLCPTCGSKALQHIGTARLNTAKLMEKVNGKEYRKESKI
jgi:hypothetical protein